MLLYWTIFSLPALAGIAPVVAGATARKVVMWLFWAFLVVTIGLRHEIGCDWNSYLFMFQDLEYDSLSTTLTQTVADPGYSLLTWFIYRLGFSIHAVNLVCGAIFAWGLTKFCARQPLPWLALVVAIPYTVVVVAMGYTRQATALGFLMLALNAFADQRMRRFFAFLILGALFHKTLVIFGLLAVVLKRGRAPANTVIALGFTTALAGLLLASQTDHLIRGYVEQEYDSEGATYRLAINALAATLLAVFLPRWRRLYNDARLYTLLSLLAITLLPMLLVSPVGADRIGLYLLPLQIAVFSRLPHLVEGTMVRGVVSLGVAAAYGSLMFVWLNYSSHAQLCWVPYRSVLF